MTSYSAEIRNTKERLEKRTQIIDDLLSKKREKELELASALLAHAEHHKLPSILGIRIQNHFQSKADLRESAQGFLAELRKRLDGINAEFKSYSEAAKRLEKRFETTMSTNKDILALNEKIEKLTAKIAKRKEAVDLIKRDCMIKKDGYLADKYFSLLNHVNYDTPKYKRKGLRLVMDRWIAQRIDYTQAKRDFDTLSKLPAYAQEQLDNLNNLLKSCLEDHQQLIAGIRTKLQIDNALARVNAARERYAACFAEMQEMEQKVAELESGEDQKSSEISRTLLDVISGMTPGDLEKQVQSIRDTTVLSVKEQLIRLEKDLTSHRLIEKQLNLQIDALERKAELQGMVKNNSPEAPIKPTPPAIRRV